MSFHDRRWNDRGGSTAFCTPSLRAFHAHVTRQAFDAGWLRLYTLALDGEIAAAMYGFLWDGRFYFYQHGFSAAHADHSVGLVLMALTIRAAIDEGAVEFDMLYGHEAYKKLWAREARPLGRLQIFPPHLGGTLQRRQAETRRALRTFARQLGLKTRHGHP
jgi:CelD/BcsL family acetyltransferase involved in cellulose biosynthesis